MLDEARSSEDVVGCLFLTLDDEEMLTATSDFPKPIVLVNGDDPSMRLSSITPCNRSAARLATEHLLRLGHQRILFLMRRGRRTIERRYEGWQDAMRRVDGFRAADLAVEVEDWLPELGAAAIENRVSPGLDFTAVLAAATAWLSAR